MSMGIFLKNMENNNFLKKNILARISIFKLNAFARKCQLNTDTLADIVKGNTKNPGVYTVAKIADVFGCSVDELVSENEIDGEVGLKIRLARSCITITVNLLRNEKQAIPFDNFLRLLEKIYLHSLKEKAKEADIKFAHTCINDFLQK